MLAPLEAIPALARYTAGSIALGLHICDFAKLRRLPDLVRPFAPLIPALHTVMLNTLAVVETVSGDNARARELYLEVLQRLDGGEAEQLEDGEAIRAGVTFGLSVVESRMGLPQAAERLRSVESQPHMLGNALCLRAMLALQRGDWGASRELKLQAEQAVLESDQPSVFGQDHLPVELELHALGLDLSAIRQLEASLARLSQRFPGWRAVLHMAHAERARLTGDLQGCLRATESALQLCGPEAPGGGPNLPFPHAAACKLEVLAELEEVDAALGYGRSLVDREQPGPLGHPRIVRALALVEAKAGHADRAWERLEGLIGDCERRGVEGIELGLLHEAAAYHALWSGDQERFRGHAERTAQEYQRVGESGFSARYKRLRDGALPWAAASRTRRPRWSTAHCKPASFAPSARSEGLACWPVWWAPMWGTYSC